MLQRFRNDPAYLNKYYAALLSVLALACAGLTALSPPDWQRYWWYLPAIALPVLPRFMLGVAALSYAAVVSMTIHRDGFRWAHLTLVPLALALTPVVASYAHNAAHRNLRPRFLRRPVGELCSLLHVVGFPEYTVVHFLHHKHTDDPEWDPHPPGALSYWQFLEGARTSVFRVLNKQYAAQFGQEATLRAAWKTLPLLMLLAQALRLHFFYFLLGPYVFTFFFLPTLVGKAAHYAFANYVTHRPDPQEPHGHVIRNLSNGLLYRWLNATSHGFYFHRNHHDNPNLFNPSRLPAARVNAVRTISPASERASAK